MRSPSLTVKSSGTEVYEDYAYFPAIVGIHRPGLLTMEIPFFNASP